MNKNWEIVKYAYQNINFYKKNYAEILGNTTNLNDNIFKTLPILDKHNVIQNYDDIIDLPHHVSKVHPQMSIWDRSAQFAPFAALTGHEEAIAETARLTNEWHEPDEDKKRELDEKMNELIMLYRKCNFNSDSLYDENVINTMTENYFEVTYFVPDEHKEGGSYEHVTGYLKKLDSIGHLMIVVDDNGTETVIDTRRIYDIDL